MKVLEPISVGPMELPNRFVMTAMHLGYLQGGEVNDRFIELYRARARGGAGLIVVGGAEINDQAAGLDNFLSIKEDRCIPQLRRLTDALHDSGARVAVNLYMSGLYSLCGLKGLPIPTPSKTKSFFTGQETTPMSREDIERVQEDFARAARRAREAGFDAVEILAAAYLISQFLSSRTNLRDDEYGGSLENRMRFGLEIVEKVRREAGADMAVIVRISGNEFMPLGCESEDTLSFARECQQAGADAISVTGGGHESRVPQVTREVPRGGLSYLARQVREAVDIPVIASNRVNNPATAERILREGMADMVGMARAFLADPEFVNKLREGGEDEIRPCVACNERCFDHLFQMKPVACMVNPRTGREEEAEVRRTASKKKILVAGAGPAGCEFALTASKRGHTVIVCDQSDDMGGQVGWAAVPTSKPELLDLIRYYRRQLEICGVEVRTGTEVTPQMARDERPDLLVVATGAVPRQPEIHGAEGISVVQAWDILKGRAETGRRVVIVGGGSVGLETALFLARQGTITPEQVYFLMLHEAETAQRIQELMLRGNKEITVVEMDDKLGKDIGISTRWVILKELKMRGIESVCGATMEGCMPGHLICRDREGEELTLRADTIVLALGSLAFNPLEAALSGSGIDVRVIGDACTTGKIGDAIEMAFDVAREV